MQVRFVRLAVLALALSVAAAGCGKYTISNIRSAKAFQDATALYTKQDYKGAAPLYEKAVSLNPDMGFAYFFLGNSYDNMYKSARKDEPEMRGYLDKAATNYRLAIDKLATSTNPKEQEVRHNAFEYLIALYGTDKLDDFAKAEAIAREMIAVDPSDPGTYRILAKLYEDQGRFDDAEREFQAAIQARPNEALGYQLLAAFYGKQGNFEKVIEAYNKRAEVEPKNPEAWQTIAAVYQEKVYKDKSLSRATALQYTLKGVEAVDRALALSPEYFEALIFKNILLKQQALYEKDTAKQKALLAESDVIFKKANEIKAKQSGGTTPTPTTKPGKGGN